MTEAPTIRPWPDAFPPSPPFPPDARGAEGRRVVDTVGRALMCWAVALLVLVTGCAGARYVRHHLPLRTVLVRSGTFVAFASAVWSLLPLVARRSLGLGAVGYGLLLGCLGVGAVSGAWFLPWVRQRMAVDRLMAIATLAFAAATATVALVTEPLVAGAALVIAGMAWMANMSSINTAAQTSVSTWVRARALAVSLLVIQGGMALGALTWGTVANDTTIRTALLTSSVGLVLGLLRQHGRMTVSDRALQTVVRGFHTGDEPPVVTHLLAARAR